MNMSEIHEKENQLSQDWKTYYEKFDEQKLFCFDGLCFNGEVFNNGYNSKPGNEEELWEKSKRKILFLTKDTNNNPEQDYREWAWI